ncbi:MAG: helix-turn-helix domain-containing protein [Phycisphaerae bacterium]|nr:helix-turn-helix domain-containing protein [Phycisphaerae bacterium]
MAGKFYTLEEVSSKLNKTEAEIKELVREGKLREFRDGAKLFFKVDEVDKLSEEFGKVDLSAAAEVSKADAAASSEISLLLDESGEIGLDKGKGKDNGEIGLKLSEDDLSLDKLGEIAKSDTKLGSTGGINILAETDEGYKLAEDTKGETVAEDETGKVSGGLDDDINMESIGSGSGLLDLSLQADDTSLGAVLDDILPTSKEGEAAAAAGGEESAQAADRIFEKSEAESPQAAEPVMAAAAVSSIPMGPGGGIQYYEPAPTGADNVCSIVLFIPLAAMIVIGLIMLAAFRGIVPGLLKGAGKEMFMELPLAWVLAIVLSVLILLLVAISGMSGRPKKEKKAVLPIAATPVAKKKKGK